MKKLDTSRSLLFFLDELEFTEAALAASPDTADLAPAFQEAIGQWDEQFAKERQARREVVRASAVMSVKDATLDRITRRFAGLAFVEANQDRTSRLFQRFFPEAPSRVTRWSLRKQCEHTLNVMVQELEKLPEDSVLRPFAPTLRRAAQETLLALNERNKKKAERSMTGVEVDEWKDDVNRLRLATYGDLLRIASEKGYGRAWAEAFFRVSSSGRGGADDETITGAETLTEPAPESGGSAPTDTP